MNWKCNVLNFHKIEVSWYDFMLSENLAILKRNRPFKLGGFYQFRPGNFSGGYETACFSDSMWNAMRLRPIAPRLHEREQQVRTRPWFGSLVPQCKEKKMASGCIAMAFCRHSRLAHCSAVSSPQLKLPGSGFLRRKSFHFQPDTAHTCTLCSNGQSAVLLITVIC